MQLQVALDRMPVARAVELTRKVSEHVDWIEVGTSLIKAHGMAAVAAVVAAAGSTPVLADMKTADDAVTEVDMCHAAGARAMSVLALAPQDTVRACTSRAQDLGMEVLVDLLAAGAERLDQLLAECSSPSHLVWAAHIGKDQQERSRVDHPLDRMAARAKGHRLALAGGLGQEEVAALAQSYPDLRVIVGSAITKAADPAATAAAFRQLLTSEPPTAQRKGEVTP
ncbi:orotidine 5'-phosphate decarboxylase / HUMPS family protein [Micromonospora sp. NPDC048830]|uniref:orotidine 5'-phosphate decarboxylase / HUMPS family protein n=1 Tax=Micromonospora sp. NPDC048830 TaxID=3364257 RepID=UPI00371C79D4